MALGICLTLAASVAVAGQNHETVSLATDRFTLAWVHSIEKVRWEEDYAVVPPARPGDPPVLRAVSARVKGSAAGMEPGPDAILINGWYVYSPSLTHHRQLMLSRSFYTPDYELCLQGDCRPMSDFLQSDGGATRLWPCEAVIGN